MLTLALKDDFEAHATLALQHADRLAAPIQQLGGVPIYNPAEIASKAAGPPADRCKRPGAQAGHKDPCRFAYEGGVCLQLTG